jgi:hypothetical protein
MKEVEVRGACSTNEVEDKSIQEFNVETVRKENAWNTLARLEDIIKMNLKVVCWKA